jgi:hypothetical protein
MYDWERGRGGQRLAVSAEKATIRSISLTKCSSFACGGGEYACGAQSSFERGPGLLLPALHPQTGATPEPLSASRTLKPVANWPPGRPLPSTRHSMIEETKPKCGCVACPFYDETIETMHCPYVTRGAKGWPCWGRYAGPNLLVRSEATGDGLFVHEHARFPPPPRRR